MLQAASLLKILVALQRLGIVAGKAGSVTPLSDENSEWTGRNDQSRSFIVTEPVVPIILVPMPQSILYLH